MPENARNRKRKTILVVAAGAAALLALAAVGLAVFLDIESYKPKLEAAASDALGMEVRIGGRMRLALSPPFGVAMEDVRVRHREVDLLRAHRMRVGLRLIPLLRREIRIAELRLVGPAFDIRRRGAGKLDVERYVERPLRRSRELFPGAFSRIARVVLAGGVLAYSNAESGIRVAMGDVDATLRDLSLGEDGGPDAVRTASFTGTLEVGKVESERFAATGVKADVRAEDGGVLFDRVSMTVFGGAATGSVRIEAAGEVPVVEVRVTLPRFRIEKALEAFSRRGILQGEMAFSAGLSMKGEAFREMKDTVGGEVSLRGKNLLLPSVELDRTLADLGKGGVGDLAGVADLFLAGPLGAALTGGHEFAGGPGEPGGREAVREFVSDWRVTDGVAEARDVALSAGESRIALRGALDLANGRFDDVTVALLDPKGCAVVSQKIGGTFRNPEVGKASRRKALPGPAPPSLREAKKEVGGEECPAFYSGSVAPPHGSEPGEP